MINVLISTLLFLFIPFSCIKDPDISENKEKATNCTVRQRGYFKFVENTHTFDSLLTILHTDSFKKHENNGIPYKIDSIFIDSCYFNISINTADIFQHYIVLPKKHSTDTAELILTFKYNQPEGFHASGHLIVNSQQTISCFLNEVFSESVINRFMADSSKLIVKIQAFDINYEKTLYFD